MAHPNVVAAVQGRLGTSFNGVTVIEMNYQGETPSGGEPFIMVQFPVSNTERVGVSDRSYREEGGFRLVINTSRGVGLAECQALAAALADHFRDQEFNGVKCRTPSSPFFDDSNDNGSYFTATMVVPYDYGFRDDRGGLQ